jgi:hypothetical protein
MELSNNFQLTNVMNQVQSNDPWQGLIAYLENMQNAVNTWLQEWESGKDPDPTTLYEILNCAIDIGASVKPSNPEVAMMLKEIVALGRNIRSDTPEQVEQLNTLITSVLQDLEKPN